MSLNKTLGSVLDKVVTGNSFLAKFGKLKVAGADLRSYFRETDHSQCQILFYRDKWWTKEGGTLYGELFCLVPMVQLALCGRSQSLAAPDYAVPFHHFQFGLLESNPERSWLIHSDADAISFEATIRSWLVSTVLPWFEQFDSNTGVIEFMERKKCLVDLALLHAALGNPAKSKTYLSTWISLLPRQIDRPLAKLLNVGLLSAAEHDMLTRASLQREDHYREIVSGWIANPEK